MFSFKGEEDSGPIDGALASGEEEAAKSVNNVSDDSTARSMPQHFLWKFQEDDDYEPEDRKRKKGKKRKVRSEEKSKGRKKKKRKKNESEEEPEDPGDSDEYSSSRRGRKKKEKDEKKAQASPVLPPAATTSAESNMPTIEEVCSTFDLTDVPMEYSDADFQNLITYKMFQQHVRPRIQVLSLYFCKKLKRS